MNYDFWSDFEFYASFISAIFIFFMAIRDHIMRDRK